MEGGDGVSHHYQPLTTTETVENRRDNIMMYTVTINFAGFIGCEESYEVYADSREEAERLALEEAMSDLEVTDIEEYADDE